MPLFDSVRSLPLVVERVELEHLSLPLRHMTRHTTVVHLHGGGHEGVGEDVSYGRAPLRSGRRAPDLTASTQSSPSPRSPPSSRSTALGAWIAALAWRAPGRQSLAEAAAATLVPAVRRLQSAVEDARASIPTCAQARRSESGRTRSSPSWPRRDGDVFDLKGLYEGDWSMRIRRPSSTAGRAAFPTRCSRMRVTDETAPSSARTLLTGTSPAIRRRLGGAGVPALMPSSKPSRSVRFSAFRLLRPWLERGCHVRRRPVRARAAAADPDLASIFTPTLPTTRARGYTRASRPAGPEPAPARLTPGVR